MEFKNYKQLVNTGEMTSNAAAVEITEIIPNIFLSLQTLNTYMENNPKNKVKNILREKLELIKDKNN